MKKCIIGVMFELFSCTGEARALAGPEKALAHLQHKRYIGNNNGSNRPSKKPKQQREGRRRRSKNGRNKRKKNAAAKRNGNKNSKVRGRKANKGRRRGKNGKNKLGMKDALKMEGRSEEVEEDEQEFMPVVEMVNQHEQA